MLRNRLSRGAATLVSHRVPATLYSSCTRVQNPKGIGRGWPTPWPSRSMGKHGWPPKPTATRLYGLLLPLQLEDRDLPSRNRVREDPGAKLCNFTVHRLSLVTG